MPAINDTTSVSVAEAGSPMLTANVAASTISAPAHLCGCCCRIRRSRDSTCNTRSSGSVGESNTRLDHQSTPSTGIHGGSGSRVDGSRRYPAAVFSNTIHPPAPRRRSVAVSPSGDADFRAISIAPSDSHIGVCRTSASWAKYTHARLAVSPSRASRQSATSCSSPDSISSSISASTSSIMSSSCRRVAVAPATSPSRIRAMLPDRQARVPPMR